MPMLKSYVPPQRTHWAGCWRYADHHACAVALVEELAAALQAMVAHAQVVGEAKNKTLQVFQQAEAVLAKVNGEESNG